MAPKKSFSVVATERGFGRNIGRALPERAVGISANALLKIMRDPKRTQEAREIIERFAAEADPSKPGHEGNEILMPVAQALAQLSPGRRKAVLEAAGNPELFAGIPTATAGELAPVPPKQAKKSRKDQSGLSPALRKAARDAQAQSASLATFAGHNFGLADERAPIDRELPRSMRDPETNEILLPPGHPDRVEAEGEIIKEIIGLPAWQQYKKIERPDGEDEAARFAVLPRIDKPTVEEVAAENARLSRASMPPGTSAPAIQRLQERISEVEGLPVDPEMEPLSHLLDKSLVLTPEELAALPREVRMAYDRGEISTIDDLAAMSPPDITDGSGAMLGPGSMPEPFAGGLIDKDSVSAARTAALGQRSSPYASLIEQIRHRQAMEPARYSDAPPTALPSGEMQESIIGRLRDELADAQRRRDIALRNPTEPPIDQRENISPMTIGTLGLQSRYQPRRGEGSMTVDQQLQRSVRSTGDRLLEKLYMASREFGGGIENPDVPTDAGADLAEGVWEDAGAKPRGLTGSTRRRIPIDLDQDFPEWRYQFAIPSHDGSGMAVSTHSLSGRGLARIIAGKYGVEDVSEFENTVWRVLEDAISRQHNTTPSTQSALEASQTLLVPNMRGSGRGRRGQGYQFFNNPFGRLWVDNAMFDARYPMAAQPVRRYSDGSGDAPLEIPFSDLGATESAPGFDIDDSDVPDFGQPGAATKDEWLDDSPDMMDARDLEFLDEPAAKDDLDFLDEPAAPDDFDLSMNKARRSPLTGLLA